LKEKFDIIDVNKIKGEYFSKMYLAS